MQNEWTSPDGRIRLINADSLDVRSSLPAVDAVLTDPPYGLGEKWNGGGGEWGSSWAFRASEVKAWDGAIAPGLASFIELAKESVVWGGHLYELPASRCWLVWDKKMNDGFTTGQCELAWTNLDRPIRCFRFAQCELANEGPKQHPTQKPLALMRWCLKWLTGETILDPFAGSCTTAIACIRTNRRCIAIEKERKYWEIGVQRCKAEYARTVLFNEAEAVA
jgi:site-specific DNA-methyltransferase (adenine-specific)